MFIHAKLALCFLIAVLLGGSSALPLTNTESTVKAEEAQRVLKQVSVFLKTDKTECKARLSTARKQVTALKEQLTQSSITRGDAKLRFDKTKTKFEKYIGDHDACLLDLRALDTAGLISLEKLNKVKMSLAKLSAIPHKNSSFSATTALQVDSKVHRPHDKLITKMSAYIENMVVKVGKESKEKKATCDQIYSVIEREDGLRNRVINATAVLKRDEHIYDRVKSKLTAEKKTVQLLQEELMNTGLLIGEEDDKVGAIKSALTAMELALNSSSKVCASGSKIPLQAKRLALAIEALVTDLQRLKQLQAKKVVEDRKIEKEASTKKAAQEARLDAFKESVTRMEQEYRVLAAERKSDKSHCLVQLNVRGKEAEVLEKLIDLLLRLEKEGRLEKDSGVVTSLLEAVVPMAENALKKALLLIQDQKPGQVAEVIKMLRSVQTHLQTAMKDCDQLAGGLKKKKNLAKHVFTKEKASQDVLKAAVDESEASKTAASEALMGAKMVLLKTNAESTKKAQLLNEAAAAVRAICT